MGYGDGVKGYRVWSPSENRVVLSCNVFFDEISMIKSQAESSSEAYKGSTNKQVELQNDHKVVDLQNHTENQDEQAGDVQIEAQLSEVTRLSFAKD